MKKVKYTIETCAIVCHTKSNVFLGGRSQARAAFYENMTTANVCKAAIKAFVHRWVIEAVSEVSRKREDFSVFIAIVESNIKENFLSQDLCS